MSLLAIIPARAGSKRLPGKNFMLMNGKSLVRRAVECAREAGIFAHIHIATDENRHPYICDDGVQTAAVVFDTLCKLDYAYDEFCVLNPTTPTRTAEMLRRHYRWWQSQSYWSMASGTPGTHDGAFLFVNTREFLRRMKIIDADTWWFTASSLQVDINTKQDFDDAEEILIEREGDKRDCATTAIIR